MAKLENGPWIPGPYKIEIESSGRDGARASINAPAVRHSGFASFVWRMSDGVDDSPKSAELRATVRLFLRAPEMAEFLRRTVIEHGARGGRFNDLLPVDGQTEFVREAMLILEEIYRDGD